MKGTKCLKKRLPIFVLGIMLAMPNTVAAYTEYLSMVTNEKEKSISAICVTATIQGGAMQAEEGIEYKITSTTALASTSDGYTTLKPNQTFKKSFSSSNGYAKKVTLSERQTTKEKKGIGWGRIDY